MTAATLSAAPVDASNPDPTMVRTLVKALCEDGCVALPPLVSEATLQEMQATFASRLARLRWNDCDGYERTETYRHMVQDVLTLAQGFVDVPLHPLVKAVLGEYIGPRYELCEAKGWLSLPTGRVFNNWHGDAWYDQAKVPDHIPREVKLGMYLTDVKSGAFQYIKRSHGKVAPRLLKRPDIAALPLDDLAEFQGTAGTAFLFDTSGVHRQAVPILEPRYAVFFNYHDPAIPLQAEDLDYNRYHPLLLNAALLGNLAAEDRRALGFGNKTNFRPGYLRAGKHHAFQALMRHTYAIKLRLGEWKDKVLGKLRRLVKRG